MLLYIHRSCVFKWIMYCTRYFMNTTKSYHLWQIGMLFYIWVAGCRMTITSWQLYLWFTICKTCAYCIILIHTYIYIYILAFHIYDTVEAPNCTYNMVLHIYYDIYIYILNASTSRKFGRYRFSSFWSNYIYLINCPCVICSWATYKLEMLQEMKI